MAAKDKSRHVTAVGAGALPTARLSRLERVSKDWRGGLRAQAGTCNAIRESGCRVGCKSLTEN